MATGRNNLKKELSLFFYLLSVFSFICSFSSAHESDHKSNSNWYWSQPQPSGNLLYSIHFTDLLTGYAAGELGTIFKTTDGGVSWNLLSSNTNLDLYEVIFINGLHGFAAGKSGLIINTSNGGNNWMMIPTPNSNDLHDITFINKFTGFIAGLNGTILKTTNAGKKWINLKTLSNAPLFCLSFLNEMEGAAAGYNTILKTTDGGISWIKQNINFIPSCAVTGISFVDSSTIYATGNPPAGSFYKTTNNGINWESSSLDLPYVFGGSVDLVRSMYFINMNTGFIVTDFGTILKTTNTGNNWQRDSSFKPFYEKLSVMYDVSAAGTDCINISGSGGTIIRSTNSGSNWIAKTGNKRSLQGSCFVNTKTGYAVGERGVIQKTEDEGTTWVDLSSFTTKFLNSIFFINENTGYTAGDSGAIYKTTNSGVSWINQTNYVKYNINCTYFLNDNEGIVAGGNPENGRAFIYRTDDGGASWYEVYDSISLGVLNSVDFKNGTEGIALGNNGNILRTFDRGESWSTENISSENLNSIDFLDTQNGLITGKNGLVYKTTNGGTDWLSIVSGYYFNLSSVIFYNKDFAIAAGDKGTILKTSNGGINWIAEQKITNNNLYSINILNESKLFALGEHGTIIYSDINKSVLVTTGNTTKDIESFTLSQNFPNPFNPVTIINYQLSMFNSVKLKVYDILGTEVTTLVNQDQKAGNYNVKFDASDISSGIYFYSLYLNGKLTETRRMVVLK